MGYRKQQTNNRAAGIHPVEWMSFACLKTCCVRMQVVKYSGVNAEERADHQCHSSRPLGHKSSISCTEDQVAVGCRHCFAGYRIN